LRGGERAGHPNGGVRGDEPDSARQDRAEDIAAARSQSQP